MALFLVRWWKTKFLSGYKQFTGADEDEETDQFLKKAKSTDQIKLKELECDVSISECPDGKGRDRQEFSFTLYDFDGHGKITKDDIAGLVTTIYETLGSSVKVPHCGSKTIRVKLIVSPNTDHNHNDEKKFDSEPKPPSPTSRSKNEHNSSPTPKEKRFHKKEQPEHNHFHYSQSRPTLECSCCGHSKKRSSSFQKQQLLKILQANMEKNNLAFQPPRRHPAWHHEKEKTSPRPHYRLNEESIGRHHQKHKDREAEQARAMAQVVRWLEREFIAPKKHHHVHEHVHHHYHHYRDPPLVS